MTTTKAGADGVRSVQYLPAQGAILNVVFRGEKRRMRTTWARADQEAARGIVAFDEYVKETKN